MRIDEISAFVRVLESGSFVAAARSLHMPTTTVSAKVAALERRLGITLIQRTTRKLRATAAGELYFDRCRSALKEIEAAETELAPHTDSPAGVLRLTAPVVVCRRLLPSLIGGFRRANPEVKVEVLVTDRPVNLVAEGIDLAVRVGPLKDSSLVARVFMRSAGGFYASPRYLRRHGTPSSLQDLARHQIIGFGRTDGGPAYMVTGGRKVEVKLDAAISSNDFYMSRAFIEMDLGIGYLPSLMAEAIGGEINLLRVLPEYSSVRTGLYFAYPRQRFVPTRIKRFISYALAHPTSQKD
jgi:DNA-binding transcriptional LysR family regulator